MANRFQRGVLLSVVAVCLVAGALRGTERDLYVTLPKALPNANWKKYLGEIGSDTLVTYKVGDGDKQSTVSLVWFQDLYQSADMLQKLAPTLKKVLETNIHKNDAAEPDKLPAPVFGMTAGDKTGLVVYFAFKHAKTTEERLAGTYRYYYLFKKIDDKTSLSLGIEVRLMDAAHEGQINDLLAGCGFRTEAEIQAEAQANAPKPAEKPAAPAPGDKPTEGAAPAEAPKPADK